MSERQIIPIEDEAAATIHQLQTAALRDFIAQWTVEEMPACPVGMELLHYFSLKYPGGYELARQKRFIDPPPGVTRTLGWQAYCQHVSGCPDCGEGGGLTDVLNQLDC